jgi:hypothetical protein
MVHDMNCVLYIVRCLGKIRGRVSKYVTNGSKTAEIDVIGFLCALIDS